MTEEELIATAVLLGVTFHKHFGWSYRLPSGYGNSRRTKYEAARCAFYEAYSYSEPGFEFLKDPAARDALGIWTRAHGIPTTDGEEA